MSKTDHKFISSKLVDAIFFADQFQHPRTRNILEDVQSFEI